MSIKHALLSSLLLVSVSAAVLPAHAEEIVVLEAARPVLYQNGGIGSDEQAYMRKTAKDFNLRLSFSEAKSNEYISDVRLSIFDNAGNLVFNLQSAGPLTNLQLPDGRYRVAASFKGLTEIQQVTITDKQGHDLSFHWSRPAKS
ncbi:hypothetical protein J8I26_05910 [Herbaspirillum sp. LeCh32-8]|uniref:hypothetical protein n=1 Tax=Herbaspirillum sp. LeCh32-8 TaxID=2821356 RepID=UPI001AE31908|nr:hypothetical protein [Herbaspirillum sp. LeCh32-8]MBP0597628.1 hypothetical protein [Herbaspirillum sp. LeCh32-8]